MQEKNDRMNYYHVQIHFHRCVVRDVGDVGVEG